MAPCFTSWIDTMLGNFSKACNQINLIVTVVNDLLQELNKKKESPTIERAG